MNQVKQPQDDTPRVHLGGGWYNVVALWVRAASSDSMGSAFRLNLLGFRCALRGREPRV